MTPVDCFAFLERLEGGAATGAVQCRMDKKSVHQKQVTRDDRRRLSEKAIHGNGDYRAIGIRDARGRSRDAWRRFPGGHVIREMRSRGKR